MHRCIYIVVYICKYYMMSYYVYIYIYITSCNIFICILELYKYAERERNIHKSPTGTFLGPKKKLEKLFWFGDLDS